MVFTYIKQLLFRTRSESAADPMPPSTPGSSSTPREALTVTPASRKRLASNASLSGRPAVASKASRRHSAAKPPTIKSGTQDEEDDASQSMDESSDLMDNVVQYSDMGADDEEPCSSSSLLRTPSASAARPKPDRRRTGRGMSVESDGSDHSIIGSPKRKTFYTINDLHTNKPAERFRTDILTQIRAPDSEYTPSSEEGSMVLRLTDRWREEWSHGVQVLLHPKSLPSFDSRPCDIPAIAKPNPFRLPATKYLLSKPAPEYQKEETHVVIAPPPLRIYQGDRLDELWLERLNREHVANRLFTLDRATMLDLMNEFEIECYQNIHRRVLDSLASPTSSLNTADGVDQDAPCDVCLIKDNGDDDMIFCDGCNKCVHLSCYGYTDIPKGHWDCDMCKVVGFARHDRLKCALCPNLDGTMKQVIGTDKWVHISCVLWIPEFTYGRDKNGHDVLNATAMETVSDQRYQLKCSICDLRNGACIQCDYRGCATAYHTTCAQRSGVCEVFHLQSEDDNSMTFHSYCKRHTALRKREREGKKGGARCKEVEQSDDETDERSETLRSLERAFFIHVKFEDAAKKLNVIPLLASDVYEYWKQKRSENGGRPLIANPHMEIDVDTTAPILNLGSSASNGEEPFVLSARDEVQGVLTPFMRKGWRFHKYVFQPMDKGRTISDMVKKRERYKGELLKSTYAIFNKLLELDSQQGIPLSTRVVAQILDDLQKDMTEEEIAKSDRIAEEMVSWHPPQSQSATSSPVKKERKESVGGQSSSQSPMKSPGRRASVGPPGAQPPTTSPAKREKTPVKKERKESAGAAGQPAPQQAASPSKKERTSGVGAVAAVAVAAGAAGASRKRSHSSGQPSAIAAAAAAAALLAAPSVAAAARHASPTKENGLGARGRGEAAAAAAGRAVSPGRVRRGNRTVSFATSTTDSARTTPPPPTPPTLLAPPPAGRAHSPSKAKTPQKASTTKTPSKRLRPQNPPDDPPETAPQLRERREVKYSK